MTLEGTRLTQTALAKALGVSQPSVSKAVSEGRLTPGPDGRFILSEAVDEWFSKTDMTRSRAVRPSRQAEGAQTQARRALETVDFALEPSESDEPAERDDGALRPDEIRRRLKAGEAMTFAEARTANEILKARQADIKLDELEGRLIPAADVQALREAEHIGLRDRLRAIPMAVTERLLDAAKQGASASVVARMLLTEIDAALEDAGAAEVVVETAA
jgi:hypothetical protein